MVDIQSATTEIRREKKKEEEETTGQNIMSASAMQGGHNEADVTSTYFVLIGYSHRKLGRLVLSRLYRSN